MNAAQAWLATNWQWIFALVFLYKIASLADGLRAEVSLFLADYRRHHRWDEIDDHNADLEMEREERAMGLLPPDNDEDSAIEPQSHRETPPSTKDAA